MQPNQFGKFLLLKRLAVGGMAEIYLARQTGVQGFEKLVVVKKILPQLAVEQSFVNMFLDEARLAASLSHPNVVQIYDLGKEGESYYIAMEFIAGHDLASVVKKARKEQVNVPVEIVAKVVAQACEGLHYAHTLKDFKGNPLNIVHRDISPSNVLVSYSGAVKVVDFGIAKAESHSTKTQAGTLKGKYSYMSPEQIRGLSLDGRSDVFALGITLYEVLVGKRLFKRDNELAIIKDILEGEVPPPSHVRPDVPPELDAIVMRAMEKDRKRRFASAQEMQLALEGFLARQSRPTTSVDVADFMSVCFAEELTAYQRLLSELPTATNEQLAKLLAQGGASGPGSQSASFSDPRLRGITADTSMPARDEEDEPTGVNVRRPVSRGLKIGLAVAPLALAAIAGVGYLASRSGGGGSQATSGRLDLGSTPPGAQIFLGTGEAGKFDNTGKQTPTALDGVPFGPFEVRLELAGFQPRTAKGELSADRPSVQLSLELQRSQAPPGTLQIATEPPGAKIFVNGREQPGRSPLEVKGVESGTEHLVRASLDGYVDEAAPVTLKPEEVRALKIALKARTVAEPPKPGPDPGVKRPAREVVSMDLATNPPADVLLDGRKLCTTPCAAKLPVGRVSLTFSNAALDLRQTVQVTVDKAGGRHAIEFKKGKLAAQVEPWADVYLGDRKLGTTPLAPRELYEGTYKLKLINSDLGAIRDLTVKIEAGKTTVLREKLN